MVNKFKVGDRVRTKGFIDGIYTVLSTDGAYYVNLNTPSPTWHIENLELVTPSITATVQHESRPVSVTVVIPYEDAVNIAADAWDGTTKLRTAIKEALKQ